MFLCYMTSMKYLMFYDIYNMKLSVVIYPYPAFSLANAPPIASQSLGTNSILKLKYFAQFHFFLAQITPGQV